MRSIPLTAVLGCLGLSLLLVGCDRQDQPQPPQSPAEPQAHADEQVEQVADQAIPESLPTVDADAIHAMVAETAETERITVIDFWATWCIPCVAMFPELHQGLVQMGERVRPISITLDGPGESEEAAIAFLNRQNALKDAYLLEPDSDAQVQVAQSIGENWNSLVVPAIFVYDQNGNLAGEFFDGDASKILQRVSELLAQ